MINLAYGFFKTLLFSLKLVGRPIPKTFTSLDLPRPKYLHRPSSRRSQSHPTTAFFGPPLPLFPSTYIFFTNLTASVAAATLVTIYEFLKFYIL